MKNEAIEVLKMRRSIRSYKPEQVSQQDLDLLLEIGTYAPTSKGLQCPVIVAVQDKATVEQLARMNAEIMGVSTNPYYNAPTIVLVFAPKAAPTRVEDGSAVMTQLLAAAYAIGLGSCWINREKQMFETEEGIELLKKWGLSEEYVGIGGLALGYPDGEHPTAKPRKDGYIIKV